MKNETYRIDRAYEKIYKLRGDTYSFYTTFFNVRVWTDMNDKTILKLIEKWENE